MGAAQIEGGALPGHWQALIERSGNRPFAGCEGSIGLTVPTPDLFFSRSMATQTTGDALAALSAARGPALLLMTHLGQS